MLPAVHAPDSGRRGRGAPAAERRVCRSCLALLGFGGPASASSDRQNRRSMLASLVTRAEVTDSGTGAPLSSVGTWPSSPAAQHAAKAPTGQAGSSAIWPRTPPPASSLVLTDGGVDAGPPGGCRRGRVRRRPVGIAPWAAVCSRPDARQRGPRPTGDAAVSQPPPLGARSCYRYARGPSSRHGTHTSSRTRPQPNGGRPPRPCPHGIVRSPP
jgi:hypothetical protein